MNAQDLQDLEVNGWALVSQGPALNVQPPAGIRTIEVDSKIDFGKTVRQWIYYYPEKVTANIISWGDHRDTTVRLQQATKSTLVYTFTNEPKGVFIRKTV